MDSTGYLYNKDITENSPTTINIIWLRTTGDGKSNLSINDLIAVKANKCQLNYYLFSIQVHSFKHKNLLAQGLTKKGTIRLQNMNHKNSLCRTTIILIT